MAGPARSDELGIRESDPYTKSTEKRHILVAHLAKDQVTRIPVACKCWLTKQWPPEESQKIPSKEPRH